MKRLAVAVVDPREIRERYRISIKVYVGKKRVNLTITELNLLAYFLENAGKDLSRAALLSTVWDQSYRGTKRTVDTHINRLRSKLGMAGYSIRTVRGVGYRLEN